MTELLISSEKEFIDLANSLGQPVSSRINSGIIDNLIPLNFSEAHSQSLSANYGVGAFPFHTDGAYFKIPPRFIILRYIRGVQNPTPTVLCDLKKLTTDENIKLKEVVWKVKSRNNDFLSTILSDNNKFYRYDRNVMTPVISNNNTAYFEHLVDDLPKTFIDWEINKTVVIDNWNFLHSRPNVSKQEVSKRTIQRIMVL